MSKEEYDLWEEREKALKEEEEQYDSKDKEDDDAPEELTFDWDRMKDQAARLTIHSGSLSDAVLSKDGNKLYYLIQFDGTYNIWETDLRTRDTKADDRSAGQGSSARAWENGKRHR